MASHDSASEEDLEIARILDERHSKNTTKSTNGIESINFVKAAGNVAELQDKEVLDKSLAKFYANAEKKDGSKYKANAMFRPSFNTLPQPNNEYSPVTLDERTD